MAVKQLGGLYVVLPAHVSSDHPANDLVHVEVLEALPAIPPRSIAAAGAALPEVLLERDDTVSCSNRQLKLKQVLPRQQQEVIDTDLLLSELMQVVFADTNLLQDVSKLARVRVLRHRGGLGWRRVRILLVTWLHLHVGVKLFLCVPFPIGKRFIVALITRCTLPAEHWGRTVALGHHFMLILAFSVATGVLMPDLPWHGSTSMYPHLLSLHGAILAQSLLSRAHPALLPLVVVASRNFRALVAEAGRKSLVVGLPIVR